MVESVPVQTPERSSGDMNGCDRGTGKHATPLNLEFCWSAA